jgi:hypothetical protein
MENLRKKFSKIFHPSIQSKLKKNTSINDEKYLLMSEKKIRKGMQQQKNI